MANVQKILDYIFGSNPKTRFKRMILTAAMIFIFVMAFLNLTCGIDKGGNWFIKWTPGAKIEINK